MDKHYLTRKPLTLSQANLMVATLHRHHKPAQGHRFSIGAYLDGALVGAVIVGRPVARALDPDEVTEVTRLVTDGTANACSYLYATAAKVAREMGFIYIQTYILLDESGVSLKAAGWKFDGLTSATHRWTNRDGRRSDQPVEQKQRWIKML